MAVTPAQLKKRVSEAMDIPFANKTQEKDYYESLGYVIEELLEAGETINLFGLVKITPVFRLAKPKRKGTDPRTGEETTFAARPAKIALKANPLKKLKDALPSTTSKNGKVLRDVAQEKADKAVARREAAEKAAAKAERAAKKSAK
jgi:nucleoid DNA-binding protein